MDSYGERLRNERLRLHYTQKVFAEMIGISQASQVGYESGARIPSIHYLVQAASIGVDPVYVMFGKSKLLAGMDMMDWPLQDQIQTIVERWLEENELKLPVTKKMHIVRLLVPRFSSTDDIDPGSIAHELSQLVA